LSTRSKKGVEMRMKTTISLYGHGNEVVSWCTFCIWSWMFFLKWIVITCVVLDNACYSIYGWVGLVMTTFVKVRKPSLVIRILIIYWVWWGKRWETSLYTCAPLSKIMVVMVSQRVSWAIMCSLSHKHQRKLDTQIINGMSTLIMWKMCNHRMWQFKASM
jgi:hypothetical protein